MTTSQIEFTADELLADETIEEPLIVDGVRCHGGFDSEGNYVSPRTKYRWPAIHAWEEQREAHFASPILDIPLDTWPENFPNVEQSKFLIRHGAPEPTISALTRIGTVEGFGVLLRSLQHAGLLTVLRGGRRRNGHRTHRQGPVRGPCSGRGGIWRRRRTRPDVVRSS